MKRSLTLLAVVAAGVLAYCAAHWWRLSVHKHDAPPPADSLAWVQKEFRLTDSELAAVEEKHRAYQPKCAEMCRRIEEANQRVATLLRVSRAMTPELEAAIRASQLRQAECQTAMLAHIYETATLMPAEAAQSYLKTVTSRVCRDGQCIMEVMEEKP